MRGKIRIEDLLTVFFCSIMTLLTLLHKNRIPNWQIHISINIITALICIVIPLSTADKRNPFTFHLRHWYVLIVVPLNFMNLKGVIHGINPHNYDQLLIEIDHWIFGVNPTQWLQKFINPWLTEYLQWAYMSYFLIPIVLGIILYKSKNYKAFRISATVILTAFYLSYLGYLVVPAIGPRFTLSHQVPLKGVLLTTQLKSLLNILEPSPHDCFPSGHTAVALVCVFLAARYNKKLFFIYLIAVSSLIIATVYHRYHYVIDLIAGTLLALFSWWISDRLFQWWEKKTVNHGE
jgi:membrane-associated phospholipid phosphatase